MEHCGNIIPDSAAPGEPPRYETKQGHWTMVSERLNPSFKNRLTVIAPLDTQSGAQRRRFSALKEASHELIDTRIQYTCAQEFSPWILFHHECSPTTAMKVCQSMVSSHREILKFAKAELL